MGWCDLESGMLNYEGDNEGEGTENDEGEGRQGNEVLVVQQVAELFEFAIVG